MFPESTDTVAQEEIGNIIKVDELTHIVLIFFKDEPRLCMIEVDRRFFIWKEPAMDVR